MYGGLSKESSFDELWAIGIARAAPVARFLGQPVSQGVPCTVERWYHEAMTERDHRELEWLENEVRHAASLSDADRIKILRDLLRTADAIRSEKSAEEIERDEEVRRILNDLPGRERYAALAERLE